MRIGKNFEIVTNRESRFRRVGSNEGSGLSQDHKIPSTSQRLKIKTREEWKARNKHPREGGGGRGGGERGDGEG